MIEHCKLCAPEFDCWTDVVKCRKSPIIAIIAYAPEAPDGQQVRVALTEIAKGMLSTLTDFELKVFAAEVSLMVRKRIEMPPSPPLPPKAGSETP